MRRAWFTYLYVKSPIVKIGLAILFILLAMVVVFFQLGIEPPRMEAQTNSWNGRGIEQGAEIYRNNCSSCHGLDGKGLPNVAPALNSHYFFTQRKDDVGFPGSLQQYVELTVAAGRPSKIDSQWAAMMPTWHNNYGGPLRDDQVKNVSSFVMNWERDALEQAAEEDPWQQFADAPSKGSPYEEGGAVEAEPAEPAGPRPPQDLFLSMGCSGCHNLSMDQDANNQGQPGPHMGNLWETAASRVPGEDAETYVHNSIVDPNAFLVPGYMPNLMPQTFADQMSAEEIDSLVTWILDPNRPQ